MNTGQTPDEQPRFLADAMLGSLAKWLRLLGYDTVYDNSAADPELARRARAEGRVLLTRDHELAGRRGLHALLIHSEVLEEQVREVLTHFDRPHPAIPRCGVCNGVPETVTPDRVADRVPPYVLRTQTEFRRCPGCGRIYWPGTHVRHIQERLSRILEAVGEEGDDD